jgi:hypothetical protein
MKWLENNPLGVALAGGCGLIVLVAVALAYIWSRPASSGAPAPDVALQTAGENRQLMNELGPITEYREVTERPVFDESRRPVVQARDEELNAGGEPGYVISGAPEVKLSGVVITPENSWATLAPISGGESFVALEGKFLEGEYEGWALVQIEPRHVVLRSRDGDRIQFDLQVNTREIEVPPELVAAEAAASAAAGTEQQSSDGEQPLSRAEEIRQRIAERREELRRQAEAEEADSTSQQPQVSKYQSAIQNMMKIKNEDKKKDDDESDGGSND